MTLYFDTSDVATLLDFDVRKARRWLLREGAVKKRGGRWYTTREKLLETFPELAAKLGDKS